MPDQASNYSIEVTRKFLKDLRKIPRHEQVRIRRALGEIETNPFRGRKVVGAELGQYRWRVGNYRIRYDIGDELVVVLRVLKREDAYRQF
ncbi:MAG: type II toxin-antitoxin system RelE/ParE family toxin [Chloroflexi bacterium]|nr:MAG: type II toxin-antitoxin system RelE/ParE family toxin [Chloroflexota bacterium]